MSFRFESKGKIFNSTGRFDNDLVIIIYIKSENNNTVLSQPFEIASKWLNVNVKFNLTLYHSGWGGCSIIQRGWKREHTSTINEECEIIESSFTKKFHGLDEPVTVTVKFIVVDIMESGWHETHVYFDKTIAEKGDGINDKLHVSIDGYVDQTKDKECICKAISSRGPSISLPISLIIPPGYNNKEIIISRTNYSCNEISNYRLAFVDGKLITRVPQRDLYALNWIVHRSKLENEQHFVALENSCTGHVVCFRYRVDDRVTDMAVVPTSRF